jgi:predicted GNAT family N-acyltransferase
MNDDKPDTVAVREARWPEDERILAQLRTTVFVDEQRVPREIEWDGRDSEAWHVLAELDGEAVGCGRLLPDGRIGRLAVLSDLRRRGIGERLLEQLLAVARREGLVHLYLHAQLPALAFYERQGFTATGEVFQEASIDHRNMALDLDYTDWNQAIPRVAYPQPFAQLTVAQARLARREIALLSPTLDRAIFEQDALVDALRALIRHSNQSRVRILVRDLRGVVGQGHRLLQLAQRLPSRIELRRLAEHPDWEDDSLVLRDRSGVLTHHGGDRSSGSYRPDDRGRAATALSRFEELWRVGTVDPEFRRLSI